MVFRPENRARILVTRGLRYALTMMVLSCGVLPPLSAQAPRDALSAWRFTQGVENRWGGMYNVFGKSPSWARSYLDPAVHMPGATHSLRITAHREATGFCGVWFEFYPASGSARRYLDATSYKFLSFWTRGLAAGGHFEVTLEDDTSQTRQPPSLSLEVYLPPSAADHWQEVLIPLKEFRGVNFGRLLRLTFNFPVPGDYRFFLDEVAFKSNRSDVQAAADARPPKRSPAVRKPIQGMWVWDAAGLLGRTEEADRLFEFCSKTKVSRIFLSVDFDPPPSSSGPSSALRNPENYRQFLERAHQRHLEVEALAGSPEWSSAENHAAALGVVDAVLRFNRPSARPRRFDGIHFDVEPYALMGFADAARGKTLLADFLRMISICKRRARAEPGLRFTCDVPAYFFLRSGAEAELFRVEFDGSRKAVGEHLMDLLDVVTIMDYRNEADGAGGAIAGALPALRSAASKGKTILVGIETSIEADRTVYFVCGLPRSDFRKRLAANGMGSWLYMEGWRLASFSDEINIHPGLVASDDLTAGKREAFEKALCRLARQLGAVSLPDQDFQEGILDEARAALAQDAEWDGFDPFELIDPESHRPIRGFRSVHRMPAKTTFHGLGLETFDEEVQSIHDWLSPFLSFGGLAIHHYESYRDVLEGQ